MQSPAVDADVLVVGAGPTGLAAANALALRGIDVKVIDAQQEGANTSRAAVIHARTLEALDSLGVADRLAARGVHAVRFTIRDRDRVLVTVPFEALPTRFPYALMISQAQTEAMLRQRYGELGGQIRWQCAVAGVEQRDEIVTVTLRDGSTLRARYVVAADGMHSTLREQLGIPFPGERYAQSFSLADVRLGGPAPESEVRLHFSPAGLVVIAPLPDGMHRIVATADAAPEIPDVAYVQGLLDARGPEREKLVVRELIWGSRFRVHHRIAESFRAGRVLLAGDAAHVHSPAGGQGMNTGIQDGIAVASAIESALATGSEEPLQAYEAARRPVAEQVVAFADRLTRLATTRPRLRPVRNAVLRAVSRLPAFRRELAWRLSGLVFRQAA